MKLRMKILNKISPEQQKVKRYFGPQLRLASFNESQVQSWIAEQNSNIVHIDIRCDFGRGTCEQQDDFKEDFVYESQYLEIIPVDKNAKKHKHWKHQRSDGQSPWTIVQLDELSGTAREGPRPVMHKIEIEITYHSIMNVDLMGMITNQFSVPREIQHQQNAEEAAQVHHTPRETFSINGNVRRVASSTDSIVAGQVEVAVTKSMNTQTASSTQLQGNLLREPKVEKNGGRTPVRELNKGGDSYTRNLSTDPNEGNITTTTKHSNVGKKIRFLEMQMLVNGMEFIQKGFLLLFKNEDSEKRLQEKLRICPFSGSREEEIAYTEKLMDELRENITEQIHPKQAKWFNPTFIIPKPHQKLRKILDASSLNQEIQTIHFKMNGTDQVRDLISKGDWATSLDLKSVFHQLIVYPPHRPYLAIDAMGKVYQYRAMPFGARHSPIIILQCFRFC
ncbi:MAG: hypothetical protein EZS28_037140 [Streblomastix strix]|uniref:Reverse transcriptase domain-containing protein n=1 Tax=Streblomastix strix TaxID=222440 RepID=A0A5J4UAU9_9EUKA|nr:MAG: hypothetical protein EZS28_037140 [Streblomastix strix]